MRREPPNRLSQMLCGIVGHPHGHRATEFWSIAKEWAPLALDYGVYVCDRCHALMPGQARRMGLQFR